MDERKLLFSFTPRNASGILMPLVAIALSFYTAHQVIQFTPLNADETSYLFQAHAFRDGVIRRPWPVNENAFNHGGMVLDPSRGWFSRYPFGHPLFLVPGILIGNPYLWTALIAGVSLTLLMKTTERIGGKTAGILCGSLLIISPYFIVYHSTLLSHASGLLCTSLMLWAYLRWQATSKRHYAIIAGFAWAFFLNIRTYTALLLAVPFGLHALYSAYRNRKTRPFKAVWIFALSAFAGLPALLVYNQLTTGKAKRMTYLMYNPTETLGFGPRIYGRVLHTPARGWEQLVENTALLDQWLFGTPFSLLLVALLILIGWKKGITPLLIASILSVPLGYIAFWYKGPQYAGPGYYFEILPFLISGAALGLSRIANRVHPAWVALGLLALGTHSASFFVKQIPVFQADVARRKPYWDQIAALPPDTLLFISRYEHRNAFDGGNDLIFNPRGLQSPVLIANWNPDTHQAMVSRFPDRTPLRLIRDEPENLRIVPAPADPLSRTPLLYALDKVPQTTGENQAMHQAYRGLSRVAQNEKHPPGWLMVSDYRFVAPGNYTLTCEIKTEAEPSVDKILIVDLATNYGEQILSVTPLGPTKSWQQMNIAFQIEDFALIEPRIWYTGEGRASLHSVQILADN